MFNIEYSNEEKMFDDTQEALKEIEGIEEFIKLTRELYGHDWLCWGDDQIDEIAYLPSAEKLTIRICSSGRNVTYKGKRVSKVFWILDFYGVEISFFDISPEHWIDVTFIQKNSDGKYSITFGTGNCDFRYSYAKINRCWVETFPE
ncbi:MAG: hypothetical protein ACI396_06870 [Acutalibacteraceae bacterium]